MEEDKGENAIAINAFRIEHRMRTQLSVLVTASCATWKKCESTRTCIWVVFPCLTRRPNKSVRPTLQPTSRCTYELVLRGRPYVTLSRRRGKTKRKRELGWREEFFNGCHRPAPLCLYAAEHASAITDAETSRKCYVIAWI